LNARKALDTWSATNKHQDMKKAAIAGGSNVHEDANADKEYKANGDLLGWFKKNMMKFADDTNFTEENLGPNNMPRNNLISLG